MLPFWLCAGATLLCLVGAWFRKSRRAALAAVTIVWVAGFFYVPYFLYQYAAHAKVVEASGLGVVVDARQRAFYAETAQAAVIYAVLLSVSMATYLVLKAHRPSARRKQVLQIELQKALRERSKKLSERRDAPGSADEMDRE